MEGHEAQFGPRHGEATLPTFFLSGAGEHDRVELSEPLYNVLRQAVEALHRGQTVTIAARDEEITTQQAAEVLGISRATVVHLIDAGELPAHVPGSVRRKLFLSDVMAYRDAIQARRNAFIAETSKRYEDLHAGEMSDLLDEARKAR